jgi:hypothetical protein
MKRIWLFIALGLLLAAFAVPALVFYARSPLLIVTDMPFVALYGAKRMGQQQHAVSIALFRQVKTILIADGASSDILIFAITESATRPFCVLFPHSQAEAAWRYHEQFPEIPAVLIGGVVPASELPSPDGVFCVYSTDRETDLYRAGIFAGILAANGEAVKPPVQEANTARVYAFWQDRYVQEAERALFFRGIEEEDPGAVVVIVSYEAQMPEAERISCAILTGAGAGYFEDNPRMPIILFSWMDPVFTAREVAVIFDDSPWAMAVPAVQMAAGGQGSGKIPSNPLILQEKISDKNIIKTLKKSAKKVP